MARGETARGETGLGRPEDLAQEMRALPPPRRGGMPEPARKEASGLGFGVGLVLLTLIGAGTGIGLGLTLGDVRPPEPPSAESAGADAPRYAEGVSLVRLQPVVANLTEPADTWVRVDAALVLETMPQETADALAAEIAGDTLAYLRTLPLSQLEGANGLAFLREDLQERARTRSEGRVREFVIETMVVQ